MGNIIPLTALFATILFSMHNFRRVLNLAHVGIARCIFGTVCSLCLTICIFLLGGILPYFRYILLVLALALFACVSTGTKFDLALTATVISVGISYSMFLVLLTIINFTVHLLFGDRHDYITAAVLIVAQTTLSIWGFRIRRFSRGIPFLNKNGTDYIGVVLSIIVLLITASINRGLSAEFGAVAVSVMVLCIICFIIWWRCGLTRQYCKDIQKRDIQDYERIIAEKEVQINALYKDNDLMASVIHSGNKLLPSLSRAVIKFTKNRGKPPDDGVCLVKQIEELTKERKDVLECISLNYHALYATNNLMLDSILNDMTVRAFKKGVKFEVAAMTQFLLPDESIIPEIKFFTLLTDLAENAINAVEHCDCKHVLLSYTIDGAVYDLCVQDSGTAFEAETLLNLGIRKASTKLHGGACGIGYMTIFEILQECSASLIIDEHSVNQTGFTKSIHICFDKRAKYIICTDRADEIRFARKERSDMIIHST